MGNVHFVDIFGASSKALWECPWEEYISGYYCLWEMLLAVEIAVHRKFAFCDYQCLCTSVSGVLVCLRPSVCGVLVCVMS